MSTTYLILAAVFALCLAGRCVYEALKHRGRIDPRRKLVFGIVFADMMLLWMSWFAMAEQDPLPLGLPVAVRWLGLMLTIAGALLFVGALAQLRALENTTVLVTRGLFAFVRHPIYVGFILWFVAWPLYHDGACSLAFGALGVAATLLWRRNEERALVAQFGQAYIDYQHQTWF